MNFNTNKFFLAALGAGLVLHSASADRYVCRVDDLRIMKTLGDAGANEEWNVAYGELRFGPGTKHKGRQHFEGDYNGDGRQDWSLKNYYGDLCAPPDNRENNDDGFYGCNFYFDGSRSGANWCHDVGSSSRMEYLIDFRVGDYDGVFGIGLDNGPRITTHQSEVPSGQTWEKYFTRTGPEGRKARMYTRCWRESGSCADVGYYYDGTFGYEEHDDHVNDIRVEAVSRFHEGPSNCDGYKIKTRSGSHVGNFIGEVAKGVVSDLTFGITELFSNLAGGDDSCIKTDDLDTDFEKGEVTIMNIGDPQAASVSGVETHFERGIGAVFFTEPNGGTGTQFGHFLALCTGELWNEKYLPDYERRPKATAPFNALTDSWKNRLDGQIAIVRFESTRRWHDSICGRIAEEYDIDPKDFFEAKCFGGGSIAAHSCEVSTISLRDLPAEGSTKYI